MEADAEADIEVARKLASERLSLREMGLRWLPAAVGRLAEDLVELDVAKNRLTSLPDDIGRLRRLRLLDIYENRLAALPHTLGDLSHLEVLRAWDNALDSAAVTRANVARLEGLRELHLHANQLTTVPAELGALPRLEFLSLSHNQLAELPDALVARAHLLLALSVSFNRLTHLPFAMSGLRSLTGLYADHNAITSAGLPDALWRVDTLRTLDLSHNALTELPPDVSLLRALRDLRVSHNAIAALPAEIGTLPSLAALYADNNILAGVPASLFSMASLVVAVLDDNPLCALPSAAPAGGRAAPLRRLSLERARLEALPADCVVWSLGGTLEDLALTGNARLAELPDGALARLGGALRKLRIAACGLAALPDDVAALSWLEELDARGNALRGVPAGIEQLAHLRVLRLEENRLTRLPPWLLLLPETTGAEVSLDGNPALDVSPDGAYSPHLSPQRMRALRFNALKQRVMTVMRSPGRALRVAATIAALPPPPTYEQSQRAAGVIEEPELPPEARPRWRRRAHGEAAAKWAHHQRWTAAMRRPSLLDRAWALIAALLHFVLLRVFFLPSLWLKLGYAHSRIRSRISGTPKEVKVLERVFREAIEGEPESVLRVIDAHGYSGEDFLMNVGDVKGVILDNAVRRRAPKVVVELGGYIGYSAVRIGRLLGDGAHLYSIEANPLFAAIATKIVEHAGLASKVTVVVGASDVVLPTLKQRFGISTIDLLFIDHVKSLYLRDIRHVEQLGLLRRGSIVVADNVIFPGAPDYLRCIRANPRFVSHMHSSTLEYTPSVVDAVEVSEYQ